MGRDAGKWLRKYCDGGHPNRNRRIGGYSCLYQMRPPPPFRAGGLAFPPIKENKSQAFSLCFALLFRQCSKAFPDDIGIVGDLSGEEPAVLARCLRGEGVKHFCQRVKSGLQSFGHGLVGLGVEQIFTGERKSDGFLCRGAREKCDWPAAIHDEF